MNEDLQNKSHNMWIVGGNITALVIYTIFSKVIGGGIIIDAFFIFFQVLICIILALAQKQWVWFLSGIMVLIIGFSTCVNFLHM